MLQANDNFTHARYAQAIAIWQQLLESDNPDIDRAVIIRAMQPSS
ncbi:YfrE protein [Yersinia enterocolitica]|nr:YfrE protein [Yersinia enterocolitica]